VWVARPKMYSLWQKDTPSFKSEKKETTDQSRSRNSCRKKKEKNNIGGKIIIQTGSV
jgi:hypothetical protein